MAEKKKHATRSIINRQNTLDTSEMQDMHVHTSAVCVLKVLRNSRLQQYQLMNIQSTRDASDTEADCVENSIENGAKIASNHGHSLILEYT